MKTFRTIIIILGILVAGAALNTTFAQTAADQETTYTNHPKIKHKGDKDKYKDDKARLKSIFKNDKHKSKDCHKHTARAEHKQYRKHEAGDAYRYERKRSAGKLE